MFLPRGIMERMQDIGGIRIILPTIEDVYKDGVSAYIDYIHYD